MNESLQDKLERETALFKDDHSKHFLEGETKNPEIGAPFFLHHKGAKLSILLIHGFMAAPHEVREWGDDLYERGYTVYAPRLAGHGTSAVDLAGRSYHDWVESVERGYAILSSESSRIVVAGFSTGAGLALHQAIRHPRRYAGLAAVSAPIKFKSLSSSFSGAMERWNDGCRRLKLDSFQKPFAVNHPDNPEINYRRCPIHGFNQVKALMKVVGQGLSGISIPALVVQGNRDPKVSPAAGRMIFERLGSKEKKYVEIDHHQHGIVRGEPGKKVFSAVHDFLSRLSAGV